MECLELAQVLRLSVLFELECLPIILVDLFLPYDRYAAEGNQWNFDLKNLKDRTLWAMRDLVNSGLKHKSFTERLLKQASEEGQRERSGDGDSDQKSGDDDEEEEDLYHLGGSTVPRRRRTRSSAAMAAAADRTRDLTSQSSGIPSPSRMLRSHSHALRSRRNGASKWLPGMSVPSSGSQAQAQRPVGPSTNHFNRTAAFSLTRTSSAVSAAKTAAAAEAGLAAVYGKQVASRATARVDALSTTSVSLCMKDKRGVQNVNLQLS